MKIYKLRPGDFPSDTFFSSEVLEIRFSYYVILFGSVKT